MLDILLSRLKEEIAIDGYRGSSIETVWEYVESISEDVAKDLGVSITPLIDDKYKSFIWNYLKTEKELEFYENVAIAPLQIEAKDTNELATNSETMEIDNNNQSDESNLIEEATIQKPIKRKQPPKAAKKKAPPKKKAKSKPKAKKKTKKTTKRTSAGNSDDDFDANSESEESSSEESDFQQDLSEEDSEDVESEVESEEYASEAESAPKKPKPNPAKKKKAKSKEDVVKPELVRLDDISHLSYEQVNEKYGSRLYITGSYELQQIQLFTGIPPGANLSENLVVILPEILRTRSKGLLQADITKLLGIDARSTGHYCKSLEEKGAIVRNGVSTFKMRTNVCIHARFTSKNQMIDISDHDTDNLPYNVNTKGEAFSQDTLRDSMMELMVSSPDQAILSHDVMRALAFDFTRKSVKKWFNRTIDELCCKGYLRKSDFRPNHKGRSRRCLHLVKMPEKKKTAEEIPLEDISFPIKIHSIRKVVSIIPVLVDSSLESQVVQVLTASGTNGVTQKEIGFAVNTDESRILYKIMEKLCELTDVGLKRYGAGRLLEFEGKQRRYRYYTYANFKKVHENIDIEIPPLPEQEMDESKFAETDYYIDGPHDIRSFKKSINSRNSNVVSMKGLSEGSVKRLGRPKKAAKDKGSKSVPKARKKDVTTPEITAESSTTATGTAEVPATDTFTIDVPSTDIITTEVPATDTIMVEVVSSNSEECVLKSEPVNEPSSKSTKRTAETVAAEPSKKAKHVASTAPNEAVTATNATQVPDKETPAKPSTRLFSIFSNPKKIANNMKGKEPAIARPVESSKPVEEPTSAAVVESIPAIEPTPVEERTSVEEPTSVKSKPDENVVPTRLTRRTRALFENEAASTENLATTPNIDLVASTAATMNKTSVNVSSDLDINLNEASNSANVDKTSVSTNVADMQPTPVVSNSTEKAPEKPFTVTKDTMVEVPEKPAPRLYGIFAKTRNRKSNTSGEKEVPKTTPVAPVTKLTDVPKEPVVESSTGNSVEEVTILEQTDSVDKTMTVPETAIAATVETETSPISDITSTANVETEISPMEIDEPISSAISNTSTTDNPKEAYGSTEVVPFKSDTTTQSRSDPRIRTIEPAVSYQGTHRKQLVFKNGTSHKITNTIKQVNIYMEVRFKVLLSLLEDKPMWEMDVNLKAAYIKRAEEMSGPIKYAVCNKTLWRSARLLSSRGEAKTEVIECPLWNGDTVERKILVRKDIDLEGAEFQDFKRRTMERRAMQNNRSTANRLDETPTPIESLEDRVKRLEAELEELEKSDKVHEAKVLRERINELSYNAKNFIPALTERRQAWVIARLQFGWINARMLRIKAVHIHIFKLFMLDDPPSGVDKENRLISITTIVKSMSLGFICTAIGVTQPPKLVLDFLSDSENLDLKFDEIPASVKEFVFSDKNKFRRKIRSLLASMEYLGLVEPVVENYQKVDGEVYPNLATNYRLCENAPIKDRKRLGQPILREHPLKSLSDVALFWSELQYSSIHCQDDIPEDQQEPPPADTWTEELWRSMHHKPNWSASSVISSKQRRILNSYVDKENYTTPIENQSLCDRISKEANLPQFVVRRYYDKVEVAFSQKIKDREIKEYRKQFYPIRAPRKKFNPFGGRRVINLSSTRAFKQPSRKLVGVDMKASREDAEKLLRGSIAEGHNIEIDDVMDAPIVHGQPDLAKLRHRRIKRTIWTSHDDDLLIYSYAIARQRAAGSTVRWFPINALFPHKATSSARHRIGRLVSELKYVEQIESASQQWSKFYAEGIQRGEIEDPDPKEVISYDMLSYLAYFIKRLSEEEPMMQITPLPNNLEAFKKNFIISRAFEDSSTYFIEDIYESKKTLLSRMSVLYNQSLSARRLCDSLFDNPEFVLKKENDISERQIRILHAFSLMTLLTPTEVYDPFYSYSVITSYPSERFNDALSLLRDEGTLILAKQERAVPGTRYSISAKFNSLMCGELPKEMLRQAAKFDEHLNVQTTKNRFFFEYVTSGMMACLFDYMSENKLNVTMANKQAKLKDIENRSFSARRTEVAFSKFEIDVEKKVKEVPPILNASLNEKKLRDMDSLQFDIAVGNFLRTLDLGTKELCQRIIELLQVENDQGLTLYQLKLELQDSYDDETIKRAMSLLEFNDPALVVVVGFNATRYVAAIATNLHYWLIFTENSSPIPQEGKMEVVNALYPGSNLASGIRKEVVEPSLWTDINGDTTSLILHECKLAVIEYILRKPGSSVSSIHRKFEVAIDKRGLLEILDLLVKQNVVRKVQVNHLNDVKSRKSIFTKSCSFNCSTKDTITNATQTFYWVQPHYYHVKTK